MMRSLSLIALLAVILIWASTRTIAATNTITINVPDLDEDGCNDRAELSGDPAAGGMRSPDNPWDFFDPNADGTIDLFFDIFDVAFAFGLTPADAGYDPALDRSSPPPGGDVWDLGPPDGEIGLFDDIFGVAFQFGHSCQGPFSETIDLDAECDSIVKETEEPEDNVVLEAGQSYVECWVIRDPESGLVADLVRTELTGPEVAGEGTGTELIAGADFPIVGGAAGQIASTVGNYRCVSEKKYESLMFRSDLAKVKLVLRGWIVMDPTNPYYAAVGFRETWKEVSAAPCSAPPAISSARPRSWT